MKAFGPVSYRVGPSGTGNNGYKNVNSRWACVFYGVQLWRITHQFSGYLMAFKCKKRDVGDFTMRMKQEAEDKRNLTEKHTHTCLCTDELGVSKQQRLLIYKSSCWTTDSKEEGEKPEQRVCGVGDQSGQLLWVRQFQKSRKISSKTDFKLHWWFRVYLLLLI